MKNLIFLGLLIFLITACSKKDENIKIERVKIVNESGEKAIGKPIGNYITIDIKKLKIARRRWNTESIRNINRRIKKNHRLTCW